MFALRGGMTGGGGIVSGGVTSDNIDSSSENGLCDEVPDNCESSSIWKSTGPVGGGGGGRRVRSVGGGLVGARMFGSLCHA